MFIHLIRNKYVNKWNSVEYLSKTQLWHMFYFLFSFGYTYAGWSYR